MKLGSVEKLEIHDRSEKLAVKEVVSFVSQSFEESDGNGENVWYSFYDGPCVGVQTVTFLPFTVGSDVRR